MLQPSTLWVPQTNGTIAPVGNKNFLLPVVPHATVLSNITQTVIATTVAYPVLFESTPDILGMYRAGGTVSISSASPCIVTCVAPNTLIVTVGTPIVFTVLSDATKGIALATVYYVTVISGNTFKLSSTIALARAGTADKNTTGAITGTYSCVSRLYFNTAGDYEIIISAILDSTGGGGTQQMDLWLVQGNSVANQAGTIVADSNTRAAITATSLQFPISVPFIIDVAAGDFIRMDYHGDVTTVRFPAFAAVAASGSTPEIPACPSIIMTAKMIGS